MSSGSGGHGGFVASSKPRIEPKVSPVVKSPEVEYLSRLSAAEWAELETAAISQARGLAAEGYRRATTARNANLAEHYRRVIVRQYVRKIMKIATA